MFLRSLHPYHDRSSSEAELVDNMEASSFPRYQVFKAWPIPKVIWHQHSSVIVNMEYRIWKIPGLPQIQIKLKNIVNITNHSYVWISGSSGLHGIDGSGAEPSRGRSCRAHQDRLCGLVVSDLLFIMMMMLNMNMLMMMMAKLLSSSRSAVRALSFFVMMIMVMMVVVVVVVVNVFFEKLWRDYQFDDHGGVVSAIFCGYGDERYLLVILLNDLISGMWDCQCILSPRVGPHPPTWRNFQSDTRPWIGASVNNLGRS